MSVKKMGSKLAQGVRQVKLQQGENARPEAKKTAASPAAKPVAIVSKKPNHVAKPPAPRPARNTSSGDAEKLSDGNMHPRRIWPD